MDTEISVKSLRILRYGHDIFSLLQEARRGLVRWGGKKKGRAIAKCFHTLIGNEIRIEY